METAKVDIRKLQLLNDRINQTIDALNQVRLSVHGLSHTSGINPNVPNVGTAAFGLGAGALAGGGAGVWDRASLDDLLAAAAGPATIIEPQLPASDRVAVRGTWREVRDRAVAGWAARSPQRPGPT